MRRMWNMPINIRINKMSNKTKKMQPIVEHIE